MVSDDKMPELPAANWMLWCHNAYEAPHHSHQDGYDETDMHAYARAYAAEQVRELVEALEEIASVQALGDSDTALDCVREHAREVLAKHKGQA